MVAVPNLGRSCYFSVAIQVILSLGLGKSTSTSSFLQRLSESVTDVAKGDRRDKQPERRKSSRSQPQQKTSISREEASGLFLAFKSELSDFDLKLKSGMDPNSDADPAEVSTLNPNRELTWLQVFFCWLGNLKDPAVAVTHLREWPVPRDSVRWLSWTVAASSPSSAYTKPEQYLILQVRASLSSHSC